MYQKSTAVQLAAHEFGHSLGLWDAYPEANKFSLELNPNKEIPISTIMWENGKATSNDIEMVLQAFVENKQQHYYASAPYLKSKVVRCPQEFIEPWWWEYFSTVVLPSIIK